MHVVRSTRTGVVGVTLVVLLLAAAPHDVVSAECWRPPVDGKVVDDFRRPACPWCPGNRGLEYLVGTGTSVTAVETGVVTFSGVVAGTRYVVIEGAAGRLVTYGRLVSAAPRRGDRIVRGTTIGRAAGEFYFGVRVDGRYVDPASMLGELVGRRRLVPLDGRRPRPSPPPTVRCVPDDDLGGGRTRSHRSRLR